MGRVSVSTMAGPTILSQQLAITAIYERNVGEDSPLKIARTLNKLWNNGGLQYAPPIRKHPTPPLSRSFCIDDWRRVVRRGTLKRQSLGDISFLVKMSDDWLLKLRFCAIFCREYMQQLARTGIGPTL
jgi:hypothetical protein